MWRPLVFSFGKDKALKRAEEQLLRECSIRLDSVPDRRPIDDLFTEMSAEGSLSHEAHVSLLYRLVAMNFLATCKLMRDRGQDTPPDKLLWLTDLLDHSVDWSRRARDHVKLEQLTSPLNMNMERFLSFFGIERGEGAPPPHHLRPWGKDGMIRPD